MARMSETLAFRNDSTCYAVELWYLANVTSTTIEDWNLLVDNHQISTREAGKSGCAFFYGMFDNLNDATHMLRWIHRKLPNVNCELLLNPNGLLDMGDGVGSYQRGPHERCFHRYAKDDSFSCALLIDVQNITRTILAK